MLISIISIFENCFTNSIYPYGHFKLHWVESEKGRERNIREKRTLIKTKNNNGTVRGCRVNAELGGTHCLNTGILRLGRVMLRWWGDFSTNRYRLTLAKHDLLGGHE